MSRKARSVVKVVCFNRVDLVSEYNDFDFGVWRCGPKSSSVVVVVEDERLADFFLAGFFPCPPIFSNAFKFSIVKRARFGGLSAPVSTDLSGLRFRVWRLRVCDRLGYPSISYMF
jgi:hypothetical protein